MSIKDLFYRDKPYKIATSSSMDTLGNTVESADYIRQYSADRQRFVPAVDFSNPSSLFSDPPRNITEQPSREFTTLTLTMGRKRVN